MCRNPNEEGLAKRNESSERALLEEREKNKRLKLEVEKMKLERKRDLLMDVSMAEMVIPPPDNVSEAAGSAVGSSSGPSMAAVTGSLSGTGINLAGAGGSSRSPPISLNNEERASDELLLGEDSDEDL